MKFELLGREFEISNGMRTHMKILYDYQIFAEKAVANFVQEFEKTFSWTFLSDTYIEQFDSEFGGENSDRFIYPYVTETRKYLAKYDVYTLTDEEIWKAVFNNGNTALSNSITNLVLQMISNSLNHYEQRKAIEDSFKAGYFSKALRKDIFALSSYVLDYLDDNDIVEIEFVGADDANKASALYDNLTESNIPEAKRAEIAFNVLTLDPRYSAHYSYIYQNIPNAKYEIATIAKYMYIDMSSIIEWDLVTTFDLKKITCEDDAIKMNEELLSTMSKLGVTHSSVEKELHSIILDYDIKARTYDGVLYSTRELCKQAQSDDLELKNLCGNVKELDKKSCYDFISQIKNKQCDEKIKLKHITILNDRIAEYDNEYLENLVANIDSCQEDECNKIKTQINDYDASQSLKDSFLSRVEMRIHLIWDAEDFERFTDIYINTQAGNDKQIADNHKLISDTGRTGCKAQFLKALSALNDSNVEVAAKYAMAKEGGFFSSMINMGKKDTYETLTLEGKVIHPAITEKIDELKNEKPKGLFGGIKKSLFGGFGSSKKAEEPVQVSSKPKFCPECGEKLTDNVKFCPNCGKRLD